MTHTVAWPAFDCLLYTLHLEEVYSNFNITVIISTNSVLVLMFVKILHDPCLYINV